MFVSRLAAGGLLLLALLALSLDGKPVQEETQSLQGRPCIHPCYNPHNRPRPRWSPEEEQQLSSERSPLALSLDEKPVQEETQSLQRPRLPRSPLEEEEQLSSERSPQTLSLGGKPDLRPCYPPCHNPHRPRPKPRVVVQQLSSPHESPAGGTTALREELSPGPEAASGPAAAKAPAAPLRRAKGKGASASASAQPVFDWSEAGKKWRRNGDPELQADGGGGGARRLKGLAKKAGGKGCFGLKLDRIGSTSGLGC
nr:Waglerin peptide 3 [Tropidolaemus subannulatus]